MAERRSLSLIICTYRRAKAVERLLAELQGQTHAPDEILVVDGSPDTQTEAVVEARQSPSPSPIVRYFRAPDEHRGLARQRNFGIARAKGAIIAFLDDDTVPVPEYFERILACFERNTDAAGVGGYIVEANWTRADRSTRPGLGSFCLDGWIRRDDYRWRVRRLCGLASPLSPGWLPPSGHGRPVSFLPPDGQDHHVEFVMGGASAWRRSVFQRHRFSPHFEGYGLYEDLDFCIRVAREHPLILCTAASLEHYHDSSSRPDAFRYGTMVVRNGWYVWRRRWPNPSGVDRFKWWATTMLLAGCRASDAVRGPMRRAALTEALGRAWGMMSIGAIAESES